MGNTQAPAYAKVAAFQWYREGTALYGKAGFIEHAKNTEIFKNERDMPAGCMKGKIIAITGSNQGIGYQTAEDCARLGADEVHLLCRDNQRGKDAAEKIIGATNNKNIFAHQLDVSDFKAIRKFADTFSADLRSRNKTLDVLVNNAGCMPKTLTRTPDEFKHETISACTYGGAVLLTGLLLPIMAAVNNNNINNENNFAHVINVSSGGQYATCARVEDLDFNKVDESSYDGTLYYAVAKRHQIMITKMMAEKLTPKFLKKNQREVKFSSQHPGWAGTEAVKTAMPGFYNKHKETLRSPAEGCDTLVFLAAGKSEKVKNSNGDFWFDREVVRTDMPWGGTAATPEEFEALWKNVIEYCGKNIPSLE